MPLSKGKSQHSFNKNVKTEIDAGKPVKQALAISYDIKRKAQHKALGGPIMPMNRGTLLMGKAMQGKLKKEDRKKMALGGVVPNDDAAMRGTKGSHMDLNRFPSNMSQRVGNPVSQTTGTDDMVERSTYAKGGIVDEVLSRLDLHKHQDNPRPEGVESIDNYGFEEHPDNDFLSDEEDTDYFHMNAFDYHEPEAEERRVKGITDIVRSVLKDRRGAA